MRVAREKIVGWYSTGPKIRPLDSRINELFRQYCANPVFVIIDAQLQEVGLPTKAYVSVEEVLEVRKSRNTFSATLFSFYWSFCPFDEPSF